MKSSKGMKSLRYGSFAMALAALASVGFIGDSHGASTFTVTYHANLATSGAAPSSQTKNQGVGLTLSANTGTLARTGFAFAGWNTASNGTGTDYAAGVTYNIDADLTLHAKWATSGTWVDPQTPAGVLPYSSQPGWVLMFSDEFNGATLNTTKWGVDVSTQSRSARPERGIADWWWKAANVSMDGTGNLVLTTSKFDSNTMHCGSVSSDGLYEPKYGYLEARIEIADSTMDTHTAFWTQGPNMGNSDPADGTAHDGAEVDIFESAWFVSDYTKSVVHIDGYDADTRASTVQYTTPGIHVGYHVFGLEWTPNSMKIYYDGVHKVTYTGIWVPRVAEWLWLSTGASFGDIGTFASAPVGFLTSAKVDYVRVWQYAGNRPPYFVSNPVGKGSASEGSAYSDTLSGAALDDDDGDAITYSKVSGPVGDWLTIAADGTLSGTPAFSNAGTNTWTIKATDVNGASVTATLQIFVNVWNLPITLVGGSLRNGNFNANPGTSVTFAATDAWYNTGGDQSQVATRSDETTADGSQNGTLHLIRGFGVDTGHALAEGDSFDFSYVWKDSSSWIDGSGEVTVSLFVTSDNTITGVRTDLVAKPSGTSLVNNAYQAASGQDVYTATAAVAGKRLFAAIETTSAGFARIDNFVLTVTPHKAKLFNLWASAHGLSGNDVSLYADPENDAFDNLQEYAFGMDPTNPVLRDLAFTAGGGVTQAGPPTLMNFATQGQAADYRAVFCRRKDHLAAGLSYTVDFSADLVRWETSVATPTTATGVDSVGEMEAVSVPFPDFVPLNPVVGGNAPPKFFRVGVSGN